jgi:hypothetical protein
MPVTNPDGSTTYTKEELEAMPVAEASALLKVTGAKLKGTGVVRDKDGNIKYDDDARKGEYGEEAT